jgi:hypothetical protein
MCTFLDPQAVSEWVSANLHPKSIVQVHCTVGVGHALIDGRSLSLSRRMLNIPHLF